MKSNELSKNFLKGATLECITILNNKLKQNPLIAFNESDIKCYLYSLLLKKFGKLEQASNIRIWGTEKSLQIKPIISTILHSELLLPEGRIDLAIINLSNTRFAFNSKGRFGHVQFDDGNHVFIEIKATRTNRSAITSKHRWKKLIRADIEKLQKYKSNICFLLCYDFNDLLDDGSIETLAKPVGEDIEFIYIKDHFRDRYIK